MRSRFILIFLFATVVAAAYVVTPATASGSHGGQVATTATPAQAVSLLARLQGPCWLHWAPGAPHRATPANLQRCALTPRLRAFLSRSGGIGWDSLCRCPAQLGAPYVSNVQLAPASDNGRVAHVEARWYFGAIWYTSTFIALHQNGRWLVDDVYCAGRPGTTIYGNSGGLCNPTIPVSFRPRGTGTAVGAVSAVVRPFTARATGTCVPESGIVFTCPLTLRLLRATLNGTASSVFCRCQNPPSGVTVSQLDNNGFVAHVNARWAFGQNSFTTVFVALHERTGWLVDNQYCAGRPGTTVYRRILTPCR